MPRYRVGKERRGRKWTLVEQGPGRFDVMRGNRPVAVDIDETAACELVRRRRSRGDRVTRTDRSDGYEQPYEP